jgi:glycosyltransferase involved in cell wall biosynthesis
LNRAQQCTRCLYDKQAPQGQWHTRGELNMKTLILSTSDIAGGAARAAYRLHQGLRSLGELSQMLVRVKLSSDRTVVTEQSLLTKIGPMMNTRPILRYPNRKRTLFSTNLFPDALSKKVASLDPDVVNLHWIGNGFLQIETLKRFNRPVVWTLQDMWPATGGCHYSEDCDRYTQICGHCPQLGSTAEQDLTRTIWRRKHKAWQGINLTIVTPSQWMADCVKASSLLGQRRVEVVPFCLDTETYKPISKAIARDILGLPQDKRLILFGALGATIDPRKGFDLLVAALTKLSQSGMGDTAEVMIFGSNTPDNPPEFGFKAHYLGSFADDISLAIVYSAADVMIVPSLQESFGQTASEALACATPVVAFAATGLKDIVAHQICGYLAKPYESEDLARGIAWVLEDSDRHPKLCENARARAVEQFALKVQAQAYQNLFHELTAK